MQEAGRDLDDDEAGKTHIVEAMQEAGRDTIPAVVIPIHTEQELIYETLRHMKPFTVSRKRR